MARALWRGVLSFGLVEIPVELYAAEDRKSFSFSMLDRRDFAPVGYKRYNKRSGNEVEWANVVKGYEYEKGQYVVLSDEDFRRANVKASETIDIVEFVATPEIPPPLYETPYYLAPAGRGGKAYALLREALADSGRVAIAQFVMRGTPHLAAILPAGKGLILNTLRYADELREAGDLAAGAAKSAPTAKERALAKRLIDDMSGHFKPAAFHDTYHEDLMRRIREKVKRGETHELTPPAEKAAGEPRSAQVIDLAALLADSLRGGKGRGGAARKDAAQASAPAPRKPTPRRSAAQARKRAAVAAQRKRA
jgi:DNA end-binding protein Ku